MSEQQTVTAFPKVSAVIPTKDRPTLLARAVTAVLEQDYPGQIECIVVFDGTTPDPPKVSVPANRTLRVMSNERAPGLAGNRNTGYLAATGDFLAPCDDDDVWLPNKLTQQIALLAARPEASCAASGSIFHFEGRDAPRPAEREELTFEDFLAKRYAEVHISTCVFPRELLLNRIGLVDEQLPGGYGEDFELLLRAARVGPVVCVREPLARVYQNRSSFFANQWQNIDDALAHLLEQVPELSDVPAGLARIEGQRAFAKAALGDRRGAVSLAVRSLRRSISIKQSWATLLVAAGVCKPDQVLTLARRFGRGM